MKFGLEQHIIDKLIAVFVQNPKVDKAFVFGSRAKGNYRPDSDIDIALKGPDLNTDDIIAMSVAFEEKGITHKIDLINYNTIKEPELKDNIDRVGIEFYSRWNEYKILELGKVVTGNTPSSKFPEEFGNEMPFVTPTDYKNYNKWIFIADRNLSDKGINKLKNRVLPANSLLVTCIGSDMGKIAINKIPVVTNQQINSVITNEKVNPNFLYYKLVSCYDVLRTYGEAGTAVPIVNKGDFENIEITIPSDIKEQTSIASILSSLDDKIDLLHRQNKTLEQLAETLFRSYFPMTNEDNKYVELGNYVECINGVSYKSSELNPSKVGMVSLKSFDRNGGFSIDGFKEFTGKFKEKQEVVEGDLIVAHTDITQDAEVIGNPALVISNPNFETMTISMDIVKVISKVDWVSIEFLYFLMRTREFKSHCEGCANGSTVLHLNKQAIPTFEFPEPDKNNVADFTKQAREIVSKIFLNHRQLRNLVKTRDTLLPKLMSGEIRVKI